MKRTQKMQVKKELAEIKDPSKLAGMFKNSNDFNYQKLVILRMKKLGAVDVAVQFEKEMSENKSLKYFILLVVAVISILLLIFHPWSV